jgi:hypothetical protein
MLAVLRDLNGDHRWAAFEQNPVSDINGRTCGSVVSSRTLGLARTRVRCRGQARRLSHTINSPGLTEPTLDGPNVARRNTELLDLGWGSVPIRTNSLTAASDDYSWDASDLRERS